MFSNLFQIHLVLQIVLFLQESLFAQAFLSNQEAPGHLDVLDVLWILQW